MRDLIHDTASFVTVMVCIAGIGIMLLGLAS